MEPSSPVKRPKITTTSATTNATPATTPPVTSATAATTTATTGASARPNGRPKPPPPTPLSPFPSELPELRDPGSVTMPMEKGVGVMDAVDEYGRKSLQSAMGTLQDKGQAATTSKSPMVSVDDRGRATATSPKSPLAPPAPARSPRRLLKFTQLPLWQRDNAFIVAYYRPASFSYLISAQSLGYIHNESVNIWTHLGGAIIAILLSLLVCGYHVSPLISPKIASAVPLIPEKLKSTLDANDIYVFACFFLSLATCLGMSALFHTVNNHSEVVSAKFARLDHLGIVVLIWGSFIPTMYYGFDGLDKSECYVAGNGLVRNYWSMITTIGAVCAYVTTSPKFRTPAWRPFRACMYVAMGLSGVIPVLHGLQIYGYEAMESRIGLSWVMSEAFMYILGAGLYAARVPERWSPGTFDIWGGSHQWLHIFVLAAAAAHCKGLWIAVQNFHLRKEGCLGYTL